MKAAPVVMASLLTSVAILGTSSAQDDSARLLQHPVGACSAPFLVEAAGWDFCWQQDDLRGQGLELNQVYFKNESVLWKIGFPFSITKYEQDAHGPYKDTLGMSVIAGMNPGFGRGSMTISSASCPRFFGAGVLLNDQRICLEHRAGPEPAVAIWARYNIFNYRFLQGYTLDARGTIEPFLRLGGTLIDGSPQGSLGTDHFHHLYWRADFDIGKAGNDTFQTFLRPDPEWAPFRGLGDLPRSCRQQVRDGVTGWCDVASEAALLHHPSLFTKWRVKDPMDLNRWDNPKSFESTSQTHAGSPADGTYTTFDTLVLQQKGGSMEVGFEVPPLPVLGDNYVRSYLDPPESIDDPVVWFALHAFHDTRDEDDPTMTYHHVSFLIEPRDFHSNNVGENTYSGSNGPSVGPPGGGPIEIPRGIEI
jgi:hypothetical protein